MRFRTMTGSFRFSDVRSWNAIITVLYVIILIILVYVLLRLNKIIQNIFVTDNIKNIFQLKTEINCNIMHIKIITHYISCEIQFILQFCFFKKFWSLGRFLKIVSYDIRTRVRRQIHHISCSWSTLTCVKKQFYKINSLRSSDAIYHK